MMYVAAVRFADLQDHNRIYEAGEEYPRLGIDVSEARLAELSGSKNAMGYPLIKQVDGDKEEAPKSSPTASAKRTEGASAAKQDAPDTRDRAEATGAGRQKRVRRDD